MGWDCVVGKHLADQAPSFISQYLIEIMIKLQYEHVYHHAIVANIF